MRINDILISGRNNNEHLCNLNNVFEVIQRSSLRLKLAKCEFTRGEVIYLGNRITKDGISPVAEKVEAIEAAPIPRNAEELKSFLGVLNYYHRYIPDAATLLEPPAFLVTERCNSKIMHLNVEKIVCDKQVLIHHDPDNELLVVRRITVGVR